MTYDPSLEHGKLGTYTNHRCRCRPCKDAHAEYQRERYHRRKAEREQAEKDEKNHWLDEKLTVEPMREVLRNEANSIGVTNVAAACGVSARRISVIIDGYYWKNLTDGTLKKYPYKWITFRIADQWCLALGYDIREVYDEQYWRPRPPQKKR